jgi:hypothetical protein
MTQGHQMRPGIITIRISSHSSSRIPIIMPSIIPSSTIPSNTIPSTIRTTGPSACKILRPVVVLRTPPDRSSN